MNVGSYNYMPPESFESIYSEKSDIWSIGITYYELLFAHNPW